MNRLHDFSGNSFTYDNEGNRTSWHSSDFTNHYHWDGKQRLTKVILPDGTEIRYGYDYNNHRVSRQVWKNGQQNESRTYLYYGNQILEETLNGQRLALYGWGADGLASRTADGHTLFYLKDGLGSVMAIIDEKANIVQSYEYSAFGECLSGKDAVNAFRFVGGFGGQTDDDTGLVYFWNRWYDPQVGRWVSEDPLRWEAGNNHFGYVENRPTTFTDPQGLVTCQYTISGHTLNCQAEICTGESVPSGQGKKNEISIGPNGVLSGTGSCMNNNSLWCQSLWGTGPIPEGIYAIRAHSTPRWWRLDMVGSAEHILPGYRSAFRLHDGSYSYGCVTIVRDNPSAFEPYKILDSWLKAEKGGIMWVNP